MRIHYKRGSPRLVKTTRICFAGARGGCCLVSGTAGAISATVGGQVPILTTCQSPRRSRTKESTSSPVGNGAEKSPVTRVAEDLSGEREFSLNYGVLCTLYSVICSLYSSLLSDSEITCRGLRLRGESKTRTAPISLVSA